MADAGLPWSIPNAGFSIQPINGEFAAWSRGSSVPPDGWSVLSGTWSATLSRCQGGTGPYAVDFGQAGIPSTLVSDYIVVLPNTRYLLSALYRIVTGSGAALSQGVRVDWYNDSRSLISSNNVDLITNTAGVWTYSGLDITSPIQAVYAKVVVGRFNVNGSANLQVDAIKLDRAVYIPSGVISLDDVTDGVTYARPRGAYMSGGIINAVVRGAGTVATDFLFKKPNIADPDTLDGVPDSVTYGKVKNTMLTAGEVTSLSRGGSTYTTSTFFQKALDNLDSVLDGSSFRKVGTAYVDSSNRVTGVLRGTSPVAGADLFAKTLDTLDNVTNGILSRKVSASYADASGRIVTVFDGANVVGVSSLFNKGLDTLDNVSNGASYARVNAVALSAGNPKTDSLVDGTYSKVLSTHVTSGAITSLTRGGTLYATSTFFQKALDNLDNVLDGASFRKVGTAYVDSSNRVTGILRGASALAGADIFAKTLDTLDNVTDGASFRKVGTAYVDSSNRVTGVLRGTSPVAGADLFAKTIDTLDNVSNGTTYARVNATALSSGNPKTDSLVDGTYAKVLADHLTSGAITSITRSGTRYASTSFFNTGLDNLSNISNGGGFNKTSSTYVNTSGQITSVRRAGADESVDNLFKKSSDTFASVAGTLSDGQLGSNVVNASNVKAQAIDWSKLDDGSPIMAWDEGRGSLLAGRVTYTNGGTLQTPEVNQGYTSWGVTSGTTDFYVETDVQFRTGKDGFVSITYRTAGTTGWAASSTMRVFNMANTAQQATATMYGDGLWHTAVFDISAFSSNSTIRFDPQDGGAAIGAGAGFLVSNVAVGNIGVGPGGGHTLVSYRGAVGINAPKPTSILHVVTGNTNGLRVESSNSGYLEVGKTSNQRWRWANDYTTANALELLTGASGADPATSLLMVTNSGDVGIGTTIPSNRLHVSATGYPAARFRSSYTSASWRYSAIQLGDYSSGQATGLGHAYNTLTGANYFYITPYGLSEGQQFVVTSSGYVGINNVSPARELSVKGQIALSPVGTGDDLAYNGSFVITKPGTSCQHINMIRAGNRVWSIGFLPSSNSLAIAGGESTDSNFGNAQVFTFTDAGRLGVGTKTPAEPLHVVGGTRITALAGVNNRTVYSDANGTLTNTSSDATLKEDIQPLENVLPVVMKMNPVSFSWKDQERFGPYTEVGFLAQEMLELVPFVIGKNADDTFTIDYSKLTAVLARAIQELKQQIDELASSRS